MNTSPIKQSISFIWRAIVKVVVWLFGFKNPGFFWRLIALVSTTCLVIIAAAIVPEIWNHYGPKPISSYTRYEAACSFYFDENHNCYRNIINDEIVLDDVVAIDGYGSVEIFQEEGKIDFGYFDMDEGRVIAPPIYRRAWLMNDSIAVAAKGDSLYVIERNGNIRSRFKQIKHYCGEPYIFYNGVCAFAMNDTCKGVCDSYGKNWIMTEGWKNLVVKKEGIYATDQNNRVSLYDHQGNLLNPFACSSIEPLYYSPAGNDSIRLKATCQVYETDARWKGLISEDGKPVTDPVFGDIKAIGQDAYLCTYERNADYSVVINSKGEAIK